MTNKAIAWGLIITIAASFCTGVFEGAGALTYAIADSLYLIEGISMMFFGVYAIIRLFKS